MSLPTYGENKDGGLTWLGSIPSHWVVMRLGHYFEERREKVSDVDFAALSVTRNGVLPQLENVAKTDDGGNRKKVCAGDFVINGRSDRKGSSGSAATDGSCSLINIVLVPQDSIRIEFAHHLLRSVPFQEEFYRYGKGIVADLWSTNYSEMKNILLAVPPLEEQLAIATFLDRETGKIDALIAEQEKLLTLLAEKRQATISHAVTRGLNPNAPMKDSGVPWMGEVPVHWAIRRLKSVSAFTTSGPRGWSERISDEGSLFIQSGDLTDSLEVDFASAKRVMANDDAEAARTRIVDGDVVICITGAKTGNVAVCQNVPEPAFVNQHLCLVRPCTEVLPHFLGAVLKSTLGQTQFELSQYGLKQGLSLESVRAALIALPPYSEQERIVAHIRAEVIAISALRIEAIRAINLLKERRSALIAAAVTGKIDVRNLAKIAA